MTAYKDHSSTLKIYAGLDCHTQLGLAVAETKCSIFMEEVFLGNLSVFLNFFLIRKCTLIVIKINIIFISFREVYSSKTISENGHK